MLSNTSLICEIGAPLVTWSPKHKAEWIKNVSQLLKRHRISFVNFPEAVNEEREGERHLEFVPKVDHLQFAQQINAEYPSLNPLICKICVRVSKEEFAKWVRESYKKGIKYIVVVGGQQKEPSSQSFSVTEAAQFIKSHFPDISVGGISIFNRSHESERILEKMENGMTFFLSQIIFDNVAFKELYASLIPACQKRKIELPKMFVGLSPAAQVKDLEFLRWLGIDFSEELWRFLLDNENEIETKTKKIVNQLVEELQEFSHSRQIPLGFNVGHVRYGNLEIMDQLLEEIKNRL